MKFLHYAIHYPSNYTLYRNDSLIDSGLWYGGAITANVDDLAVGTYNFTLVVWDQGGNEASDSVWVTVTAISTTTSEDEEPTKTTPGFGVVLLLLSLTFCLLPTRRQHQKKADS